MSAVVLPVPAGPTTSTRSAVPATADAACLGRLSARGRFASPRPVRPTLVVEAAVGPREDGVSWLRIALRRQRSVDHRFAHRAAVPAYERTPA